MSGLGLGLGLSLSHRSGGSAYDPATVAYIERVSGDGGRVINEALTDSIIKAIKADNAWADVHSIYTSISGIKLDGSNYVTKLYDVMSATNDLTGAGTTNKPQHNVGANRINGLPTITFVAANSQYLTSDTNANNNNAGQIVAVYNIPATTSFAGKAISGGYIYNCVFGIDGYERLYHGTYSVVGTGSSVDQHGIKIAYIKYTGNLGAPSYEYTDFIVNGSDAGKTTANRQALCYKLQLGAAVAANNITQSQFLDGSIAAHITFNTPPASTANIEAKLNEIFAVY